MLTAVILALPVLAAAVAVPAWPGAYVRDLHKPTILAPLHKVENATPNSYIVTFKEDISPETIRAHISFINSLYTDDTGFREGQYPGIQNVFSTTPKGYQGNFDVLNVEFIRTSPHVAAVEQDQRVWTSAVQDDAPWGLARISQEERLPEAGPYRYFYDESGGEGVDVYVIDTGIDIEHPSFEGRASWGHTTAKHTDDSDNDGHGTHVAGIVASERWGVAKKANVIAVKVVNSYRRGFALANLISGIRWAADDTVEKTDRALAEYARTGRPPAYKGSIAVISLQSNASGAFTLTMAIEDAVAKGLHVVIAAGDDDDDACKHSPANADTATIVGASTINDTRWHLSNWGKCVDIFAPGETTQSTWIGRDPVFFSGTSQAAAHVAGFLAILLSVFPYEPQLPEIAPITGLTGWYSTLMDLMSNNPASSLVMKLMSYLVPSLAVELSVADVPKPLAPWRLKKGLLQASNLDRLKHIGKSSPNKLLYNDYPSDTLSSKEFWAAL